MRQSDASARYAERVLDSVDDDGEPERVVLWIERKEGGVWAVGRAVNPQHRESDEPRADDYIFEGFELDDALEAANGALEDDVSVLEQEGDPGRVAPFTRKEIVPRLEREVFRGEACPPPSIGSSAAHLRRTSGRIL
jgi:hypothetical protein